MNILAERLETHLASHVYRNVGCRPDAAVLHQKALVITLTLKGEASMKFPVVIHKDSNSDYGVTVPDVPGCFSAGSTFSQALDNIHEALALHLEGVVADDGKLPHAQEIDVHVENPDFQGGVWAVVDFDLTPYLGKSVRFNASLPEHLLNRIDEKVNKDHRYASRSGFLATAALRELCA